MSTAPNMHAPPESGNPDALTRRCTPFRTFGAFCDDGYTPTLATARGRSHVAREERELADLFDAEMARRGEARRAYRGRSVRRG